jgi:succinoglycan biosynthesis protein ExoM
MTRKIFHISVCVCTYKRPELLRRLLRELVAQDTAGAFTYSIVVADNDQLESAKGVVEEMSATSAIPFKYCVEPRQNIALTRNKAVEQSEGDYIAFFDDDQFPTRRWLLTLLEACQRYRADGVLGPVKPHFDEEPPRWIIKGKFYERATYPTGFVIDGEKGRTGNVLLRRGIFAVGESWFRSEFRTGEDQDFFTRMIEKGYVFVWCEEAVGYEVVPPIRWKRKFMLRRALLRGASSSLHAKSDALDLAKSVLAVPVYTAALPFALLLGQHRFMTVLIKLFDHLAKLLASVGINPIKEQYVTE